MQNGLGSSLFARRYLENVVLADFFYFPPGTEMFYFPGCAFFTCVKNHLGLQDGVPPFRNLRVKGCSAPRRSLSQLRYVFHRFLESRHPPYALNFLLGNLKITIFVFPKLSFLWYQPLGEKNKSLGTLSTHGSKTHSWKDKCLSKRRNNFCAQQNLIFNECPFREKENRLSAGKTN